MVEHAWSYYVVIKMCSNSMPIKSIQCKYMERYNIMQRYDFNLWVTKILYGSKF